MVILIIGWIVAVVVRAGVRRLLAMARLNSRIAETTEQKLDLESGVSAGAFWLIILDHADRGVQLARSGARFRAVRGSGQGDRRLSAAPGSGHAARPRRLARRGRLARHRHPRARRKRPGREAICQRRHAADAQERRQHALLAGDSPVRARDPPCLRPGRSARSGQGDGDQDPRHAAERGCARSSSALSAGCLEKCLRDW